MKYNISIESIIFFMQVQKGKVSCELCPKSIPIYCIYKVVLYLYTLL